MAVKRQTQVNSQEELLDSDFPTDTPPQCAVKPLPKKNIPNANLPKKLFL